LGYVCGHDIKNKWNTAWDAIKDWASNVWSNITTGIDNWKSGIKMSWDTVVEDIKTKWSTGWDNIKNAVSDKWIEIRSKVEEIINGIKDKFNINWSELGNNIVNGIVQGLRNKLSWLKQQVENIASAVKNAFGDFLNMGSPSKVFAEMGEWSAEGYGIGLMDTMKKITPNINNSLSGVGVSGGAGAVLHSVLIPFN